MKLNLLVFCCVTLLSVFDAPARAEQLRPNTLFILMGDLAWNDAGCLGSKYYVTPNIDQPVEIVIRGLGDSLLCQSVFKGDTMYDPGETDEEDF